ncbi:MAG: LysM peptidoglycan-binding domain-containing protein [Candidatus Krumholzibacteria bacterium]|nr:LysM peptidoglycan-binding domain-containing protein [Candidatus Krumholzibacteria bacterium]
MKKGFAVFFLTLLALLAIIYQSGCTSSKMRSVNVAAGEYYSEDDYDLLSASSRSRYCEQLESEMATSQEEFAGKQNELENTKNLIQSIRKQIVPIEQEVLRLESDIRSLNDRVVEVKALPKEWRIKPGDTLTLIAMKADVYNDIEKWWKIFEANQDKIDDPYYIFPDTVLVIPRDWPVD